MIRKTIYLDNAATTPLLPEVKEGIAEYLDSYGNPSALYEMGQINRNAINNARERIASFIGCTPEEIIFTSCGSESNNTALISGFDALRTKGNHIITSMIEHHSVLNTCKYLEAYKGADVTYVGVDSNGYVDIDMLKRAFRRDTVLVSIMGANNEIGAIQNLYEISNLVKEHGAVFHTDCVQAFGHISLDIRNVDMFSASAHKIGGLKGVGLLYKKNNLVLPSYIHGGGQEFGRRAGTENVLGIMAFAKAVEVSTQHMYEWNRKTYELSKYLEGKILDEIPGTRLNSTANNRLANNVNISFSGIRGEELLIMLDMYGICVSTGSACNSSSLAPSHVLMAIGCTEDEANSSIRFTPSHENTVEEIDFVVQRLKEVVSMMRKD